MLGLDDGSPSVLLAGSAFVPLTEVSTFGTGYTRETEPRWLYVYWLPYTSCRTRNLPRCLDWPIFLTTPSPVAITGEPSEAKMSIDLRPASSCTRLAAFPDLTLRALSAASATSSA